MLQDADGQTSDVHSVSAGLDYPGVGPEHSYWRDAGRVQYTSVTDTEALDAFDLVAQRDWLFVGTPQGLMRFRRAADGLVL